MTTLVMAALVIFGAVGYATLPVSELPNVDFPTVQVFAGLPGADPETMGSAVAAPLENAFSTIPGIDSMTSSSSQGSTRITIQFKLDRNIDGAAQDVQAAIHHVRIGPHLRVQVRLLEHFRPMLDEKAQQVESLRGQMEAGLTPAQLPRLRIEDEWTECRCHGAPLTN